MNRIVFRVCILIALLTGLLGAFAVPAAAASVTVQIYATSADGLMIKGGATYEAARDASNPDTLASAETYLQVGQYNIYSMYYTVFRSALFFDTSSLSEAAVTAAKLKLYGLGDNSVNEFDIQIQTGGTIYPHSPLEAGDYNQANYSGDGGSFNTSGWATSGYNEITLNSTGLEWINTTGITKFMLRSDKDVDNTSPPDREFVNFASYEAGSSYWPVLEITYTASVPVLVAKPATNVQLRSAKLNALITDDTNMDVEVRFGYGTTSQAAVDFDDYDNITEWWSGWIEGQTASVTVVDLNPNTIYYYRAQIKNDYDNFTSADEIAFDTTGQKSILTDYDISVGGGILTINPDMPGTMYTELDSSYLPGGQIVEDILAQSDTPRALWWYPFIFGLIAIIAFLVFGLTMKTGGEGSILVMGIVIEVLLVAFGTLGAVANTSLIPLFPAFLMLIPVIAIIISKPSVKIGG